MKAQNLNDHSLFKEDHAVVLYVPKSGGVVLGEYASLEALSAEENLKPWRIREVISRKGTYESKVHSQRVSPRFKPKSKL